MKWERAFLIVFFGNYIINNVIAGIVSLIPSNGGGLWTLQYNLYVLLAAITVGVVTWWYSRRAPLQTLQSGIIFGVTGFVVSVLTTLVSGMSSVLAQTGSLSQLVQVLPRFGPFLWNWSTLYLLGFWVIPAALFGWWMQKKMRKPMMSNPMMHQAHAPMTSEVM
ncbi:MAG TPA: hypothetical protein VMU13_03710 [Candidatus Paceibacterota bacterium]|nr:hypothetical protein [Candidatus Paceibacterota bacterium]